jgi:hypothetical protein
VYDSIHSFFAKDLKLFHGSPEQAVDAARRDNDQYAIAVVTYRGEPLQRTSTSFLVHFVDCDKVWLPWSMDISSTQAFECFCQTRSELYLLLYSAKEAKRIYAAINKQPISEVKPGDVAYADLRWYGYDWYSLRSSIRSGSTLLLVPRLWLSVVFSTRNGRSTTISFGHTAPASTFWMALRLLTRSSSLGTHFFTLHPNLR